jgi:hypothetical protein
MNSGDDLKALPFKKQKVEVLSPCEMIDVKMHHFQPRFGGVL